MDKFIEYLLNKGKAETVVATTIFVFFPTYLIVLLYYPEWFKDTDIIKITVLNIGALAFAYIFQMIIYLSTNLVFTRKGRTMEEIIIMPIVVLGIVVNFAIFSRIICENIVYVILANFGLSVIIDIIIAVLYEKSMGIFDN